MESDPQAPGGGAASAAGPAATPASARAAPAPAVADDTGERQFSGPDSGLLGIVKDAQIPDDQMRAAMEWSKASSRYTSAQLDAIDTANTAAAEAELEHVWGPKFEENAATLTRFLQSLPEREQQAIENARDARTGGRLMDDAANVQRLLGLARRPQPQGLSIEAIEKLMRTDRKAYNKDPQLQARLRQLYDEREDHNELVKWNRERKGQ